MQYEVIERTAGDLCWSFDSTDPYVLVGAGSYPRQEKVDPFPAYAHNLALVQETLTKITSAFPIGLPLKVYSLHNEFTPSRVNGYMSYDTDHDDEKTPKRFFPYIVMSGKRIPLHPAMTRYLVAHEYGHVVEQWIAYKRGNRGVTELRSEYTELRGLTTPPYYGGGTWHVSVGEVFANDFRILTCGVESEFWPHTVEHPETVDKIRDWWSNAVATYAFREE